MKVLVATSRTQGLRDDDYCWTVEGELVQFPPVECATPGCGCRWGMGGLASRKGTSTVLVADVERLDLDLLALAVLDSLVAGGWGDAEDPELADDAYREAEMIVEMAAEWPVGTVLGRHGSRMYRRPEHATAPPGG